MAPADAAAERRRVFLGDVPDPDRDRMEIDRQYAAGDGPVQMARPHRRAATLRVRTNGATGFLVGLPIVAFGIWRNFAAGWDARYSFFFGSQYNYWGAIVVDIGWIGAIMLVCASDRLTRLKAALGALGRTAFSNYILQTLICVALFYGTGFGLFGAVSGSADPHRRRDLARPAAPLDAVAPAFRVRTARMAVAIAHVLAENSTCR